MQLGDDGRLRDLLVYHKAHTGRWAGRAFPAAQPAAAARGAAARDDAARLRGRPRRFRALLPPGVNVADAITALIRPTLYAPPGKILCIADYASVEARRRRVRR